MGMIINRRRVYGGKKGLLPSGYTQVEYIENTSTAYIETDISGQGKIIIDAQANIIKGSSQVVVCTRQDAHGASWYGESGSRKKWGVANWGSNIEPTTRVVANLTFRDNNVIIGTIGNDVISQPSVEIVKKHQIWSLFASVKGNYPFVGKVFSVEIFQNNSLVGNFIPCINPNNIVGMYDTVEGKFYSSHNGTAFIAGPEV